MHLGPQIRVRSDAASIRTKATRVDGGWKINGQKVWTSGAHYCARGLATVRTDPEAPKHAGITTVIVDMNAPEVEVRPLRQITGGSDFNEVFFNDLFVPDEDVVGEVGQLELPILTGDGRKEYDCRAVRIRT